MAKATVVCTCATCGATFEKTTTKANRREADAWEEWAVKNYDECPSCWRKRMQQEEVDQGLICKVRLKTEPNRVSIWYVGFGDTYSIKDSLKTDGWIFTDTYPNGEIFGGLLSFRRNQKRWAKEYKISDIEYEKLESMFSKANEKAETFGFKMEMEISDIDMVIAKERMNSLKEQKEKEIQEKKELDEKRGPKPQRPDWMPEGRWNGNIYGKKEKSIYVDGNKMILTDEQEETLLKYVKDLDNWKSYGK